MVDSTTYACCFPVKGVKTKLRASLPFAQSHFAVPSMLKHCRLLLPLWGMVGPLSPLLIQPYWEGANVLSG